ncbi:MAG: EamA family transporter RarD [Rhodospirillaceae bacterium]|nr:EamA family transporter RarD [Rhodospirillaceae bacterium]
MDSKPESPLIGPLAAITAFSLWGGYPLYFKAIKHVPAFEIMSHRVIWTVLFLGIVLVLRGRMSEVRRVFADLKLLRTLMLSSLLVSANWLVFIWAVGQERVLETSLGYYINPLVSVALGMIFLKERLNRWQFLAVALAVLGVGNMVVQFGAPPWVALSLAFLFGIYGLVRKVAPVGSFTGLFVETLLIAPPVLAYLIYLAIDGSGSFLAVDRTTDTLLVFSGLLTAAPLVLFAFAAKRLRLSSVGFFQYIAPTGHFLIAVYIFTEPFTDAHLITFGLIWLALAVYSVDSITERRRNRS